MSCFPAIPWAEAGAQAHSRSGSTTHHHSIAPLQGTEDCLLPWWPSTWHLWSCPSLGAKPIFECLHPIMMSLFTSSWFRPFVLTKINLPEIHDRNSCRKVDCRWVVLVKDYAKNPKDVIKEYSKYQKNNNN